jgi:hypothetical protein
MCRQEAQIPITVLLMFTDIGQEVQHANELLVRLNQWKNWRQVNSMKTINMILIFLIGSTMANAGITTSMDRNTDCTANLLITYLKKTKMLWLLSFKLILAIIVLFSFFIAISFFFSFFLRILLKQDG